jgi:hypothetical protein
VALLRELRRARAAALTVVLAMSPFVILRRSLRRASTRVMRSLLGAALIAPMLGAQGWAFTPREHVDLWLHGFALVHRDSSTVPLYRRGYADSVRADKQRRDLVTELDANAAKLGEAIAQRPAMVGAQFLALEVGSWEDLRTGIRLWLDSEGDLRRLRTPREYELAARVGTYFPTARDRDWLRLFARALDDEQARYFSARWAEQQTARATVLAAATALWRDSVAPALGRYLANAPFAGGTIIPSLVLEGEGRSLARGRTGNVVVTGLPAADTAAWEIAYGFVHEAVASVASAAVRDHTTPAQQRSGEAAAFDALALVRGGALLLEQTMPTHVEEYQRFYLRAAGHPAGSAPWGRGAALRTAFTGAFALPDAMVDGMRAQLRIILGGL